MTEIHLIMLPNSNLCLKISKGNYPTFSILPLAVLKLKNLIFKTGGKLLEWLSSLMTGGRSRSQKDLQVPQGVTPSSEHTPE